jgi:hypothetical protein
MKRIFLMLFLAVAFAALTVPASAQSISTVCVTGNSSECGMWWGYAMTITGSSLYTDPSRISGGILLGTYVGVTYSYDNQGSAAYNWSGAYSNQTGYWSLSSTALTFLAVIPSPSPDTNSVPLNVCDAITSTDTVCTSAVTLPYF